MRLLETWVEMPLADAVGWTLLHSLWEGAIISFALAAALVAIRSPRVRYAAACVALLMMVCGFGLTLVLVIPEGANGLPAIRTSAFPAWNVRTGMDAPGPSNPSLAAVTPWLAPFWIAGVCIFYLWNVAGWISVSRMRRRGVCSACEHWRKQLARLSAQLRVSRSVRLLESCLVDAPMVLGHFRPIILMPVGLLTGLPAGQIEAILLHELAHVRRYDYIVNVLQRSVEGLLFYHPAMWWISRVIRAERENCCDDVVVATRGDAHEYATALATLEQNRWSGRETAVAATGGSLVKRIRRLLYPKGPNGAWFLLFAAVILIATTAATLAAWQSAASPSAVGVVGGVPGGQSGGVTGGVIRAAPVAVQPPPRSSAAAQQQVDRSYVKWLNQDVVYIIADEERAVFQKLTIDEEREKFIEQFWLRRDPNPGTHENEFKVEHYRRIGYANQHFGGPSGRPGWRTDRGRIYIIYGPADEIEAHQRGAQYPYAIEIWTYRHIEGIGDNAAFTFVDRTGTLDYRLAPNAR